MIPSDFNGVIVAGAGQMGSGIAQVAAQAKLSVVVFDISQEVLDRSKAGIEKSLAKLESKSRLNESAETILERLHFVSDIQATKGLNAKLLVEAVSENFDLKVKIFSQFDELLPEKCIFASNTSSISISKMAAQTKRAPQFVGMHFMNPVPLMSLVELIQGEQTSEETFSFVEELAKEMGKVTVKSKDMPGFIVNRILMPMINEACFALEDGLATAHDIDVAMKLGTNQPMGPLALADLIGLDTCYSIINVLYDGFKSEKYAPSKLLKKYVDEGKLGRKTGQGFFKY